ALPILPDTFGRTIAYVPYASVSLPLLNVARRPPRRSLQSVTSATCGRNEFSRALPGTLSPEAQDEDHATRRASPDTVGGARRRLSRSERRVRPVTAERGRGPRVHGLV